MRVQSRKTTALWTPEEEQAPRLGWMDKDNFNPGYLMRGMHLLPKRGTSEDWQHTQDYWHDKDAFPAINLEDEVFVYDGKRRSA